jgi:hypothetical protein
MLVVSPAPVAMFLRRCAAVCLLTLCLPFLSRCCTLPGTAPYQVEADREYVGHELVILSHPDSAAHSPRQCASACTRYQGRVRCSAWTFVHIPSSSAGNCTLRSSKGYDAVRSTGAVSGYVAGGCSQCLLVVPSFLWGMACALLSRINHKHMFVRQQAALYSVPLLT